MSAELFAILVFIGTLTSIALAVLGWQARTQVVASPAVEEAQPLVAKAQTSTWTDVLEKVAVSDNPEQQTVLKTMLIQAGIRGAYYLEIYIALRAVCAVMLPVMLYVIYPIEGLLVTLLMIPIVGIPGYYLPWLVVVLMRSQRQNRIRLVLPDALDMLVSCLEAGLGLDASLVYVARGLSKVAPELATELDIMNTERQAGIGRVDAFRRMDARIGIEEVRNLVSVLQQAERFGSGIAQSIRAHTQLARRRRLLDAERRAAEASPKLTVAMIFFILPSLFIILIGPTVINILERIIPSLTR